MEVSVVFVHLCIEDPGVQGEDTGRCLSTHLPVCYLFLFVMGY